MEYIQGVFKVAKYLSYASLAWNSINTAKRAIDTYKFTKKAFYYVKKRLVRKSIQTDTKKKDSLKQWNVVTESS